MSNTKRKPQTQQVMDRPMMIITGILLCFGVLVFVSAALSVLPKNSGLFQSIVVNQLVFALVGGVAAAFGVSRIPFRVWQTYALPIAVLTLVVTALVFVPGLGFSHGGARRWITLGFTTLQPAELMKFGVVVYWAAFLSFAGKKITHWKFGLTALGLFSVIPGAVLLLQPDTGTFLVMLAAMTGLYFLAGAPWKHFFIILGVALVALGVLVAMRPYLLDRLQTFADPSRDPTGSSYQITQSLIAVGSGQVFGRGYGRSAQKFQYLPEPVGDSVFAVAAEELGFVGAAALVILFLLFLWRGLYISARAPNQFARLLAAGIVIIITVQAFINIASILGLMPLTGLPLSFVSHGGTSLLITLAAVGVLLQISRYQKENRYTTRPLGGIISKANNN